MTEPTHNHTAPIGGTAADERFYFRGRLHHVSWGAIFAGLVVAIALQILLGLLGLGLGFTILDPTDPIGGIRSWGIGTGIYVVLVQVLSLFAGGYIAARLSPALTHQSAMFHGLSIWALATIIMVWLGGTTVGLAVGGLSSAISAVGAGTAQAVETVIPDDINLPDLSYDALPEPIKQRLRQNGITPENFQQELRSAYRQVVSEQERRQLMQRLRQTITAILRNPAQAPEEIDQAMDDVLGEGGILSEEDLTELQNTLQSRLNLSDQEVQQITQQIPQTINAARAALKEGVQTATQEAAQAAEQVSNAIATAALWLFFANLLALVAAVVGGRVGEVKTVE
jgi:hypothetical protein